MAPTREERLFRRAWPILLRYAGLLLLLCPSIGHAQTTPTLFSVTPSSVPLGWNGTLTVIGTGFLPGDVLVLDGGLLPTTYVNPTTLTATIPCCETSRAFNGSLVAMHNSSNGIASNALSFQIGNPPVLISLNPSTVLIGSPGFNLTVTGSGFVPGSVVEWSGPPASALVPLTTTYDSPTQLTAAVPRCRARPAIKSIRNGWHSANFTQTTG
jgi:hypothetical protein